MNKICCSINVLNLSVGRCDPGFIFVVFMFVLDVNNRSNRELRD